MTSERRGRLRFRPKRTCSKIRDVANIPDTAAVAADTPGRIGIDTAICGGRPHILGTRVRVSDILALMASGVSSEKILADYPYLDEAGLKAALAYGASASDHRIIPTV